METLDKAPQTPQTVPYWWIGQEADQYEEMDFSGNSEDQGETQYFYQEPTN